MQPPALELRGAVICDDDSRPSDNDVIRFDAGKNFTDHDKSPVLDSSRA